MGERLALALVCCLLPLAGCGRLTGAAADGEPRVTCGGPVSWTPATMRDGLPGVLTDDEARAAFQGILDDPRTGGEAGMSLFPDGPDVEWRVLAEDGDALTIGVGRWTERGPVDSRAMVLGLHREGDGWYVDGWGQCRQLGPVLDEDLEWARVDAYRVTGPRDLEVDVTEMQCASGRRPEKYLHAPTILETADAVTLSWTTTPADGAQSCQSNPPATVLIELERPLADRQVLDGSAYPPREVPEGTAQ